MKKIGFVETKIFNSSKSTSFYYVIYIFYMINFIFHNKHINSFPADLILYKWANEMDRAGPVN